MARVRFQAEDQVQVGQPAEAVFELLCQPRKQVELTPLEMRLTKADRLTAVGDTFEGVGDFAARKIKCAMRCTALEPPHLLAMEVVGELEGKEEWRLKPAGDETEVRLTIDYAAPDWIPMYLRDDTTARNWSNTMVSQTLGNLVRVLAAETG